MDATLSYGLPRVNQSGTLLEGIALWGELKPLLTQDAIVERALRYCDWAVAKGLLAIRSHVDVCDPRLLAVEALLHVKEKVKPYLDLQLVAFPQDGVLRSADARRAPEEGARHGRRRRRRHSALRAHDADGTESVRILCEIAADAGGSSTCIATRPTTRSSRHIETLAMQSLRLGMQGRVNGSHLTSMHSMDNYYVSKLIPLMHEAGVSAIANPLINITIQGRHDTYPKRRGMTRVPELMAAGVTVAFGHDCVMDPWYGARQRRHARGGVDGPARRADDEPGGHARVLRRGHGQRRRRSSHLDGYGIAPGNRADFVLLQARDPVEAIRLRATRLAVYRAGRRIARTPAAIASLDIPDRPRRSTGHRACPRADRTSATLRRLTRRCAATGA